MELVFDWRKKLALWPIRIGGQLVWLKRYERRKWYLRGITYQWEFRYKNFQSAAYPHMESVYG